MPPAEYTKGAESVPAAGRAEMLKLKIRFPSVGVLQGPAAIFEPAVVDDFDGLGKAWIARGVDGLKIIKCAENVVVPSGRKRKTSEFRLDDFAGAVGAKEAVEQQELAATILRGAQFADFLLAMQFVEAQALKRADGGVDGGMGGTLVAAAIPAAVGHLLLEQVIGEGVETRICVVEVGEDGKDHTGDAGFAATSPFRPGAVADAAVGLKASIEEQFAGASRGAGPGRQTKIAEQQHGVGGGNPLGGVEAV